MTDNSFILAEITDGHPLTIGRVGTYSMESGYQQFLTLVAENRWTIIKFESQPNRMRASILVEGENAKFYERWDGIARYALMPADELLRTPAEPFVGPAFEDWSVSGGEI